MTDADSPTPPAANAKPRRRWGSYSLRTGLIVITILAIVGGGYLQRASRQKRAVATILAKGGRITYSYNDPVGNPAAVNNKPPWLAETLGIDLVDSVTVVDFIGQQFTDDDLELLDDLPRVHWLQLYDTRITGEKFAHVGARQQLVGVVINLTPLDDTALVELGKLSELTALHIVKSNITDAGLPSLAGLRKLENVSLSACAITAAGVATLHLPDSITELSLENTQFGDDGVPLLARLSKVKRITLYGSPITDAGLPGFKNMPQLKSLTLGETKVTNAGLRDLKAAREPDFVVGPDPDGHK